MGLRCEEQTRCSECPDFCYESYPPFVLWNKFVRNIPCNLGRDCRHLRRHECLYEVQLQCPGPCNRGNEHGHAGGWRPLQYSCFPHSSWSSDRHHDNWYTDNCSELSNRQFCISRRSACSLFPESYTFHIHW